MNHKLALGQDLENFGVSTFQRVGEPEPLPIVALWVALLASAQVCLGLKLKAFCLYLHFTLKLEYQRNNTTLVSRE